MRYLILLLLLSSCGPTFYLKKADRALRKAEMLGAEVKRDTVFKEVTVYVDSVRLDTLLQTTQGDTVYLEKERLRIKYVRLAGDSVFIRGECLPDTLKITVPVEVTKEIKTGAGFWDIFKIVLFAIVLTSLLVTFYWKVAK